MHCNQGHSWEAQQYLSWEISAPHSFSSESRRASSLSTSRTICCFRIQNPKPFRIRNKQVMNKNSEKTEIITILNRISASTTCRTFFIHQEIRIYQPGKLRDENWKCKNRIKKLAFMRERERTWTRWTKWSWTCLIIKKETRLMREREGDGECRRRI